MPLCFCAIRREGKTARNIGITAWWKTGGWPAAGWCSGTRFTWARSMTVKKRPGARPSRFSRRARRVRARWRCFPRIGWGRWPTRTSCGFGSANSRCIGPGSGVLAGWQASSGNRWGWIDFGRLACPPAAKARAGIGCCKFWWSIGSWIRAASGGSIGIGLSTARWPICWARTWNWPTSTSSTNVTSGCWSTSGSCSRT